MLNVLRAEVALVPASTSIVSCDWAMNAICAKVGFVAVMRKSLARIGFLVKLVL